MVETAAQKAREVQRIRGPDIKVFIRYSEGVRFIKALERADAENRVLVSNKRHDKALVGSGEWKSKCEVYPCWTGTMTGYEAPGKKLGTQIVYTDQCDKQRYVFHVDDKFRGEENAILVVEHPDFKMGRDGKELVVMPEAGKVELVSNFPTNCGWYLTDAKFGIPTGKQTSSVNPKARYFYRLGDPGRVGPVVRDYNFNLTNYVVLNYRPSVGLGVAVEENTPAEGALLEAAQQSIVQEGQRIVIKGTSEQLDAVMKTLEQLKK